MPKTTWPWSLGGRLGGIQRENPIGFGCIQTSPRWCLDSKHWIFVFDVVFWEMPKLWWFDVSNFSWLRGFGMIGGPLGYLRSSNQDHPNGSKTHLKETENSGMLCLVPLVLRRFLYHFFPQLMALCQLSHQGSTWDRYILLDLWRTEAKVTKGPQGRMTHLINYAKV